MPIAGDHDVLTPDGWIPLGCLSSRSRLVSKEDMYITVESISVYSVENDILYLLNGALVTHDQIVGTHHGTKWARVENLNPKKTAKVHYTGDVFAITTEGGMPFLVRRGGRTRWVA